MENKVVLSIDTEALAPFKADMDGQLQALLSAMMQRGSVDGTITAKLNVQLNRRMNDCDDTGAGVQEIFPSIEHKVTSVIQSKSEKTGISIDNARFGDYQLVFDEESMCYVLQEGDEHQMNMLYDDEEATGLLDEE